DCAGIATDLVTQFTDLNLLTKSFHECPHRLHGQIVKEQYFQLANPLYSKDYLAEQADYLSKPKSCVKHFFHSAFSTLPTSHLVALSVSVRRHYRERIIIGKHKKQKKYQPHKIQPNTTSAGYF
ncbi:hypothetical protein, partial [Photobacterium aquae]|uniref:hypothetical protein n=1 Tax=Photobacterium aquae TaxID=1195763 RepID=UPI000AD63DF8